MSGLFVKAPQETVDHSWNWVYRVGGIGMLLTGVLYLVSYDLNFIVAGLPSTGFAPPPATTGAIYFNAMAAHPEAAYLNFGAFSLTDFLLVPALLGLYLSLRGINKNAMLVAMGLVAVFAIVDLAVTELNSLTLVSLAQSYSATSDPTQRAAYVAAADYALGTLPIGTFFSYVVGSVGWLIASLVMRRGIFRRGTAVFGVIMSVLGIAAGFYAFVPGLSVLMGPALIAFGFWAMFVGAQLFRLGGRQAQEADAAQRASQTLSLAPK